MSVRIPVTGESPYDVVIGSGVAGSDLAPLLDGVRRVAVVHDAAVADLAGGAVAAARTAGADVAEVALPSGEAAKTLAVVADLWDRFGRLNLTRSDVVVAVGGGATTDAAGFAAATWLRGVRWVAVPTTLLGMVDAAVGGKTGINAVTGKNLVGAFHSPAGVVVDLDVLATLPAAEWVNGMAEVVKAGFIADPEILRIIEADPARAASPSTIDAATLIQRAVRVKAGIVGADLRERGPREMLNYGHTLGHALERRSGYRMPHGHAVSVGMVFAAALGHVAGGLGAVEVERHRALLAGLGLPTAYDDPSAWPELLEAMSHDKKARGATLRFVVLDDIAVPRILTDPPADALAAAWAAVARGPA